jgi:hypothetical protein
MNPIAFLISEMRIVDVFEVWLLRGKSTAISLSNGSLYGFYSVYVSFCFLFAKSFNIAVTVFYSYTIGIMFYFLIAVISLSNGVSIGFASLDWIPESLNSLLIFTYLDFLNNLNSFYYYIYIWYASSLIVLTISDLISLSRVLKIFIEIAGIVFSVLGLVVRILLILANNIHCSDDNWFSFV